MSNDTFTEVNFDGLVGPTHNYAGLSQGNLASQQSKAGVSDPRSAALQGLDKMKTLMDAGCAQGFIPPLVRPDYEALHGWGFQGRPEKVLEQAHRQAPHLLAAAWSASSMWTANAATVAPSSDTADSRLHFTPANLFAMPHRAIEASQTGAILQGIFDSPKHFVHHQPLAGGHAFADEGAANHNRLFSEVSGKAIHLFVYGRDHTVNPALKLPARQTLLASQAVARAHGLDEQLTVYAQQSVEAINAGAFHNDVVAVTHGTTLLYHKNAFADEAGLLKAVRNILGDEFVPVCISADDLSLSDAVQTYLFNSQIVTGAEDQQILIAPVNVKEHPKASAVVEKMLADPANPITEVRYPDVRESMKNGGGPACLRLRVRMNTAEMQAMNQASLLNDEKLLTLRKFVSDNYRDRVTVADLQDVTFANEAQAVVKHFHEMLNLT